MTTEQEAVLSVDATSAVVPTTHGLMGVWVNRAPFLAAAGAGKVTVRSDGQERQYAVSGGVIHVRDNVLTILAEQCRPA